jgi:signal transduction histidine kinase
MISSAQKLSVVASPSTYLDPRDVSGDRRILILDEDEVLRVTFASCLMERYSCTTASNAEEALAVLASEPVALVIMDMMLPCRNGVELLREITRRFPDTLVIVASKADRTKLVGNALRHGAYDYLVKPCELDVLELSVERALEHRLLRREAEQYKTTLEERNTDLASRQAELERLRLQMLNVRKMASLGQLASGLAPELNNNAVFIYENIEFLKHSVAGLEELLRVYDGATLPAPLAADINVVKEKLDYAHSLESLSSIVNDCHESAERIRDVVQNLRLFSWPDESKFKRVDLHEGVESTIRLLAPYFSNGAVELQRDYCGLPLVNCYAGQLNQVWMNLLDNAVHAAGREGHVRISTRLENRNVLVTISDTGKGIAPEHLDKIFEPFFTTKSDGEGAGLGLSITREIVERHHGSISVESCPGLGTTFTVTLPACV